MSKEKAFRIGTGAIIFKNGEILLGLRGPKARDQHYKWELLGGLLKSGETPQEAIKREVKEEAGIKIEPIDVIGTNVRDSADGKEQWVGLTFWAKHVSGEPKRTELDRVIDHKWLALDEALNEDLTPMTRYQLEQYQAWLTRNK
ncbi:NUDIX hydrolase [Candidatus Saccharibacteria bacterium]|nr:NUDIX hydrolase [Candidatus Saccharibacteria bacterium]